jgi:hypothetical protein
LRKEGANGRNTSEQFEYDYPPEAPAAFASGDASADSVLPENWIDIAKLSRG